MRLLLLAVLFLAQRPPSTTHQTGTVTGRLLNPDGSPAARVRVSAMAIPDPTNGPNEAPTLMTLTETDNSGRYRLTDVPVGRYYIVAGFVDSPTYYPRGTGPASATPVNVTFNATATLNDFRIERPSSGLTVSGHVVIESKQSLGSVQVMLSGGQNGSYTNLNAPLKLDGTFEFVRVRPGTYTLSVSPSPFNQPRNVVISDKDVTGLELLIPWSTDISGRAVVEGGGPVPAFNMSFTGVNRQATSYQSNQTFRATLTEGFYGVSLSTVPSGFYVKSITADNKDLLSNPYEVNRTDAPSEIVVTLGVTTPSPWVKLSGRVKGSVAYGSSALSLSGPIGSLEANIAADGSFEFAKVLPGTYSAYLRSNTPVPTQPFSIIVPNRDLTGIEIAMPVMKEITGRVTVEDGGPLPRFTLMMTDPSSSVPGPPPSNSRPTLAQLFVTTNGLITRSVQTPINFNPQPDGTFRAYVPEGQYQITANVFTNNAMSPYSLKAFTYGATDLLKDPMKVTAADESELRVTFAPNTANSWARVSGRVAGLTTPSASTNPTTVSLNSSTFYLPLSTTVRPDGTFEFPRVYPGMYSARLSGPPIVGNMPAIDVNVTGSDVTGLELVVPRQKEISGRIVLEGRGLMPQLNIPLTASAGSAAGQVLYMSVNPQPDGTFKVTLPEGERMVGRPNSIPTGYTLKTVTYGTADLTGNPLKITAADTAELRLTISTPDLPPVKVSGKVSGLDSAAFSRGPISVSMNAQGFMSALQAPVMPDGSFEFPAVFPGNYTARIGGSLPNAGQASLNVTVARSDVKGLEIVVPRQKDIPGKVVLEGRGPMPQFNLPLTASGPSSANTNPVAFLTINPQPDGSFKVSIPEGERRAGTPNGLPPGYTLKSIMYGSADLLTAPVKISASDTNELRVTVSTPYRTSVKVGGKVTGIDPAVFVRGPINVSMNAPGYAGVMQTAVAPDGTFEFPEVFPGNYTARVAGPMPVGPQPVSIVVANADVRNVEFSVPAAKEITGRIVIEGNAPIPRLGLRPSSTANPPAFSVLSSQFININPSPDGTFRLTLPEGERPLGDPNGLPAGYTIKAATYGTTDLIRAPLKIAKGDTGELVLTLSAPNLKPVSVSGRVEGLDAGVLAQGQARVILNSYNYAANPATVVRPDGSFEFPMVYPGTYTAQIASPGMTIAVTSGAGTNVPAVSAGAPGIFVSGGATVTIPGAIAGFVVTDKDIKDLQFSVPRQRTITGRLVVEGGGPLPRVSLTLSTPPGPFGGSATALLINPQSDGVFRLTLPEGERPVGITQLPAGYALKSMTFGAVNLRHEPLRIGPDSTGELLIVIEKATQTPWVSVSGKVVGLPPQTQTVRVGLSGAFGLPQEAILNADGTFTFKEVLQGTYAVRLIGPVTGVRIPAPVNFTVGSKDVTGVEIVIPR